MGCWETKYLLELRKVNSGNGTRGSRRVDWWRSRVLNHRSRWRRSGGRIGLRWLLKVEWHREIGAVGVGVCELGWWSSRWIRHVILILLIGNELEWKEKLGFLIWFYLIQRKLEDWGIAEWMERRIILYYIFDLCIIFILLFFLLIWFLIIYYYYYIIRIKIIKKIFWAF